METATKLRLLATAIGVIAVGVACTTPDPTISVEIAICGDTRTVDLKPDDVVNLSDVGKGKSDFTITSDGKVNVPGVSNKITNPNAVDYIIGEADKPHYIVKSTGKGGGDVTITKVCPAPPPDEPSPTLEPFGKGPQRLTGINPHFHVGKAPHQAFGQVYRRGGRG